jgi:hypothetical protein
MQAVGLAPPVGRAAPGVEVRIAEDGEMAPPDWRRYSKCGCPSGPPSRHPLPNAGFLLRDTDHHDTQAAILLGAFEELADDLLLDIAPRAPDHLDLALGHEPVDPLHVAAADLPQHRRRRDREPAIEQEPDHLPQRLQPRRIPVQEQPVDRPDPEGHVIVE